MGNIGNHRLQIPVLPSVPRHAGFPVARTVLTMVVHLGYMSLGVVRSRYLSPKRTGFSTVCRLLLHAVEFHINHMAFRSDTNGLETNLADTTGGYGLLFRENPKRQWMRLHYKSTIFRTVASDYPSVTIFKPGHITIPPTPSGNRTYDTHISQTGNRHSDFPF